jgi:microcystin degradation protein MlrC
MTRRPRIAIAGFQHETNTFAPFGATYQDFVDYQGMADGFLKGRFIVHQSFWPAGFYASLTDTPYKLDVASSSI